MSMFAICLKTSLLGQDHLDLSRGATGAASISGFADDRLEVLGKERLDGALQRSREVRDLVVGHGPHSTFNLGQGASGQVKPEHLTLRRDLVLGPAVPLPFLPELWTNEVENFGLLHQKSKNRIASEAGLCSFIGAVRRSAPKMTPSTVLHRPLANHQPASVATALQPFIYSFGPANSGPTTLNEYFNVRMWGSCLLHHTADWERPAPRVLTLASFYHYVPRCRTPCPPLRGLTGVSRDLGYRLVEFSLRCIERGVAAWVARRGFEPTPEEILAAIPDYLQLQEDSDDQAWMLSRAFSNLVVGAAVTNALHSRWGFPHNPRATPRTIPDALQAPQDSRRYPYSFAAPGSTQPLDLYAYLRRRAQDYPALLGRARWELDLDDLPDQIGYNDFWLVVGRRPPKANLRQASLALCYRLVWLALEYVEDYAADLVKRRKVEPTPEEIMARFHTDAKRWQPERHGDHLELYARITAHPVLVAAITNALHSRWGHPRNPRAWQPAGTTPLSARLPLKAIAPHS